MNTVADGDEDSQRADYEKSLMESLAGTRHAINDAVQQGQERAHSWFSTKNAYLAEPVADQLREEGYAVKTKKDETKGSVSLWIDVAKPEDSNDI